MKTLKKLDAKLKGFTVFQYFLTLGSRGRLLGRLLGRFLDQNHTNFQRASPITAGVHQAQKVVVISPSPQLQFFAICSGHTAYLTP